MSSYTKDEWFSVARQLVPGLTREEYEQMWTRYLAAKAEHERTKDLN